MSRKFQGNQARFIGPSRRALRGLYPSRHGNVLSFESKLERDVYFLLDYESTIDSMASQPIKIDYRDGDYYPDCLATGAFGKFLIEIKYESDLIDSWHEDETKYLAAEQYAEEHGLQFRFVTDSFAYSEYYRLALLRQIVFLGKLNTFSQENIADLCIPISTTPFSARMVLDQTEKPVTMRNAAHIWKLVSQGCLYLLHAPCSDPLQAILVHHGNAPNPFDKSFSLARWLRRMSIHPHTGLKDGNVHAA